MRKRLRKKLANCQWPKRIVKNGMGRECAQYIVNKITSDVLESIIIPVRMMSKKEFKGMYPDNAST